MAGKTIGFYVAYCPQLCPRVPGEEIYKVGWSGSLGDRLHDSGYVLNFSEPWNFVVTFETDEASARRLEGSLLAWAEREGIRRLPCEHICCSLPALTAAAADLSAFLGLTGVWRQAPSYPKADKVRCARALTPAADFRSSIVGFRAAVEVVEIAAPDIIVVEDDGAGVGEIVEIAPPEVIVVEDDDGAGVGEIVEIGGDGSEVFEERAYQLVACESALTALREHGRAILQMACRSGKTRVAYMVSGEFAGMIYFLVPTLALVTQTALKLISYGAPRARMLLVGSGGRAAGLRMTTNAAEIDQRLRGAPPIIVSTYDSSHLLLGGRPELIVFDECHNLCGRDNNGKITCIIKSALPGARLFLTATPVTDEKAGCLSMKNFDMFGPTAFKYQLREAISAGFVNDFELQLIDEGVGDPIKQAFEHLQAAIKRSPGAVGARAAKMLVFFYRNDDAQKACDAARARLKGVECFAVSSEFSLSRRERILAQFEKPDVPAIMFNCRLFGEGVEIPGLNGVYFAAPKTSGPNIIQAICRALTWADGKPTSTVFLPVPAGGGAPAALTRFAKIVPFAEALMSEDSRFYNYLLDPGCEYPLGWIGQHAGVEELLAAARRVARFGTSVKKPRDLLLKNENLPWALMFGELRRIVTECRRYPKSGATDGMELRVRAGGAFEPVSISRWFAWVRKQYKKHKLNEPSALRIDQVAELERLPNWAPYGAEGPYPEAECLDTLKKTLEDTRGVPVPAEIGCGGWIGLDATPMERLCGFLTTINQQDAKPSAKESGTGFKVNLALAAKLDDLFAPYGGGWRRQRAADGLPLGFVRGAGGAISGSYSGAATWIQKCAKKFSAHKKQWGVGCEYIQHMWPLYPLKHINQELPRVLVRGVAPLKFVGSSCSPARIKFQIGCDSLLDDALAAENVARASIANRIGPAVRRRI